jgi:hypothetical protein
MLRGMNHPDAKDNAHRHCAREYCCERGDDDLKRISVIRRLCNEEVDDVDKVYAEYRLEIGTNGT